MTQIPSLSERQLLNIDTYERAIIYSALLLRSVLVDDFFASGSPNSAIANRLTLDLITNVTTNEDNKLIVQGSVKIAASFYYLNLPAYVGGGDFLTWLAPYGEGSALAWTGEPADPTPNNTAPLPNELPPQVKTLEQFFVWCCQQLYAGLAAEKSDYLNNISFDLKDAATNASLDITATIAIDFEQYLKNNNLVAACKQMLLTRGQVTPVQYKFGNLTLVGNSTPMGN